jgi:DNA modification methylase
MSVERNTIFCGDALQVLKTLPDACVQCVVTSPPYYALRSYLPDSHPDKYLEIGLEETPAEYIEKLVQVFREVKRVLRDDGSLWVNIGDTYANDRSWGGHSSGKHCKALHEVERPRRYTELPAKNLIGIPWRLAFALQDDGWILRSDIIWSKVNGLPESVQDRPTKSHEYVFLLAKNEHYYYDADAIREPCVTKSNVRDRAKESGWASGALLSAIGEGTREWNHPLGRNKRTVWTIASQPYPEAHFAVMPPKLVEPTILAGSSGRACEHCGAPWSRHVERTPMIIKNGPKSGGYGSRTTDRLSGTMLTPADSRTVGWQPICTCSNNTGSGKCVVLDPFLGAGTVALVALEQNREFIGIELNEAYVRIAEQRIATVQPVLWGREQA